MKHHTFKTGLDGPGKLINHDDIEPIAMKYVLAAILGAISKQPGFDMNKFIDDIGRYGFSHETPRQIADVYSKNIHSLLNEIKDDV